MIVLHIAKNSALKQLQKHGKFLFPVSTNLETELQDYEIGQCHMFILFILYIQV